MENNMNVRLKEIRKFFKMTQEKFSESIGISRSNLTNIERGKIQLTDRLVKTICSIHNVDENWLRYGQGDMFINNSNNEFDLLVGQLYAEDNDFKKELIRIMLSLDDESWMCIKNFINEIKKASF